MKNKKVKITVISVVVIILLILAYIIYSNISITTPEGLENITEYTPQEEITDEQLRQTIVSLYYCNKETEEIMPEARMIDSKLLLNNPYETLINMLIGDPKTETMETVMPKDTRVIKAELKGSTVYLDLSNEFIQNHEEGAKKEENTIKAIVQTLTQLNEVNSVRILINGEENKEFKDGKVSFKENFSRE